MNSSLNSALSDHREKVHIRLFVFSLIHTSWFVRHRPTQHRVEFNLHSIEMTALNSFSCIQREPVDVPHKKRVHAQIGGSFTVDEAVAQKWQAEMARRRLLQRERQFYFYQQQQQLQPLPHKSFPVQKRKKSVRFAPTVSVATRSVDEEDLRNSWYNEQDYRKFEYEVRDTVQLMSKVGSDGLDKSKYTTVGLEAYAAGRKGMMQRRYNTMKHNAIVLELYDVQRSNGVFDDVMVRKISERFSKETMRHAYIRAMLDSSLKMI